MTGRPIQKRTRMIIEAYQAGGSFPLIAWIFGCSTSRVRKAVKRHAPEPLRPPCVNHPMEPRYS